MSWAIGYDSTHKRFVGYGVPAYCDHPECNKEINRGLPYVCGGDIWGGEYGCGLHFCREHLEYAGERRKGVQLCRCCYLNRGKEFAPSKEHPEWVNHMLNDESWKEWRTEHPDEVAQMTANIRGKAARSVEPSPSS